MSSKNLYPIKYVIAVLLVAISFILPGCGETLTDAEYLARAKEYQDKGQLDASVIDLKNALKANPDNIEARWLLGEIYLDAGLGPAAEKELHRAMELGLAQEAVVVPLTRALLLQNKHQEVLDLEIDYSALDSDVVATAWALQGHAHLGLNKPEESVQSYERAQNINPDEPEAYLGMALIAIRDRDLEIARQLLEKALEVDPAFVAAWSLSGDLARYEGDVEKAEAHYGKAIAYQALNINDRLKRALIRIQLGRYEEATADINFVRSKVKQSPGVAYAQGLIQFQQGGYGEAQISFENALSANRNYMPAVFFLGVTHYLQDNDAQARAYLSRYADKFPNNVRTQQLLAVLDVRDKDYAEARRRLARVLQLQPDDLPTLKLMATVAMKLHNTAEAIEFMRKVVAQEPDVAKSRLRLGLGLMIDGESEASALELEQAIDLDKEFKLAEFILVLHPLREGKLDEALAAARAFTTKHPDSPMAWNLLGLVQIKQKHTDEAKQSFERALEIVPGEPGATNNLAKLALQSGDIGEAIRLYESAFEQRPGDISMVVKLARLQTRAGRSSDVQALLEKTVKAFPRELEPRVLLADIYQKQGKAPRALTLMREVDDEYSDHPLYLGMLGHLQMKNGDTANAVHNLKRLVDIAPRSALAYQRLSEAYYVTGNMNKLEPVLDRVLALNPDHLPSRIMRVKMLIRQDRPKAAVPLLEELQVTYPDHPELFVLQARLALAQNRPQDAVKAYQEAVKRTSDKDLVGKLALTQFQAGQREIGIQTLKDWLAEHPDDLVVQYNLANLYLAAGMHDEARSAFTRVVEKNPSHPVALINLAALTRKVDSDKALGYASHADRLAPDSLVVQDVMAQILLDRGDVKQALRLLERAVEKAPGDMKIRFHWAQALARNGESQEARQVLNRILNEGKPFANEREARELLQQLDSEAG